MANTDNLREPLRSIVAKIVEESGGKVTVRSGFRTRSEQQRLYDLYRSGKGNLAARPGHSKHEHGMAVDFGGDLKLAAELAQKYGLVATVPGEPWHFELGSGTHAVGDDSPDFQFNLGEDEAMDPQEVLANRLHAISGIVGLDSLTQSPDVMTPTTGDADFDSIFSPGNTFGEQINLSGVQQAMSPQESKQFDKVPGGAASFGEGQKGKLQQYAAQQFPQYGFDPREVDALIQLWNRESGWNPQAANPSSSARGIAQKMTSLHGPVESTPQGQIDWGLQYIQQRYGSPRKAWEHFLRNNWY